jgi:hypothetical protein
METLKHIPAHQVVKVLSIAPNNGSTGTKGLPLFPIRLRRQVINLSPPNLAPFGKTVVFLVLSLLSAIVCSQDLVLD